MGRGGDKILTAAFSCHAPSPLLVILRPLIMSSSGASFGHPPVSHNVILRSLIMSSSGLTGGPSILQLCGMGTGGGYVVYILSSGIGGTLYIGVTSNLVRRVYEHKTKAADGFTKKHDVDRLVYYEHFEDVEAAIRREKRLKRYNRGWKISLIEEENPNWVDLYPSISNL